MLLCNSGLCPLGFSIGGLVLHPFSQHRVHKGNSPAFWWQTRPVRNLVPLGANSQGLSGASNPDIGSSVGLVPTNALVATDRLLARRRLPGTNLLMVKSNAGDQAFRGR